jgi:hypothetical protein
MGSVEQLRRTLDCCPILASTFNDIKDAPRTISNVLALSYSGIIVLKGEMTL